MYHGASVYWLLILAQLPFQMLSSPKSPSSPDNVTKKKKRKVISPLVGSKSPKVVKLATKENLIRVISEKEEDACEKKLNSNSDSAEIIISDDEKKDLNQSDQQKDMKISNTPKRPLGRKKKLDGSQKQKSGALTKFLKKADREIEENDTSHNDNNLSELKDKKDCQDASVHKEKNEICSNESPELEYTSELNETDDHIATKDGDLSRQESDCDITILSSDNEISSELDKSMSNTNKETTGESIALTSKSDKDAKNKTKKLTPKQLEKRQEIARRKEEKLKLKIVCMYCI